jgi:acyl-CoA synthetase (AMP-forming)/AMP-acid ligase II
VIYRSSAPAISIPPQSLPDYVLEDALIRGRKPALIDGITGDLVTYIRLEEMSARAASALTRDEVGPGDVVALISHNKPLYVVACYAALRAGAVVTPINPELTAGEMNKQLHESGATTVIGTTVIDSKIDEATVGTAVVRRYRLEGVVSGSLAALTLSDRCPLPIVDANSIAILAYSSGTTGASKGVMLSHRNLVANLQQHQGIWRVGERDVLCAALPMFHIYGFNIVMNSALRAGATLITSPRFDLRTYLAMVEKFGVTRGNFVPPILLRLAQEPEVDEFDLSSMKIAACGAAPLDENTAARVTERTGIRIVQGYGMTEASPGTHFVAEDDLDVPVGSVGKLLPDTEARIVDPVTGHDVEAGEPGELWIRGPQVMQGYLGRPEATAQTVTDGWLHSGDIVEIRDGNFYVVDRLKELIKYSGFQVAPAELEAVLLAHPKVLDVAVIGIPHPTAGEAPKAFVVADGPVDANELLAWTAARVASYKKVREIEFIDQVPKSPTGKILHRVLKEAAAKSAMPPTTKDQKASSPT